MSRTYPRLTIEEFGTHLFRTGDLDPVYVMLSATPLNKPQLQRWLLAYWCFYDVGVASWMSEQPAALFWENMLEAGRNMTGSPVGGRWPRGKERRHFRGQQGIAALEFLQLAHPVPESFCAGLEGPWWMPDGSVTFEDISNKVQTYRGFGPWIAFKIADMLERVLNVNVTFETAAVMMYDEPRKAALLLHQTMTGRKAPSDDEGIWFAVGHLQSVFGHLVAPPKDGRLVNIQEIETVLCKWKSHLGGHYPLNNDLHEVTETLKHWSGVSLTAKHLLSGLQSKTGRH